LNRIRIGELRHVFRMREGGDFDPPEPAIGDAIQHRDLVGGRHHHRLMLQSISGKAFAEDHLRLAHGRISFRIAMAS
jgi:hypothetical protein